MNYEDATDAQINEAVTDVIAGVLVKELGVVDYCNDWAYGGIIIQKAKINLIYGTESTEWEAQAVVTMDMFDPSTCEHYYYDKNPLRAAMIVYLKMNKGKK